MFTHACEFGAFHRDVFRFTVDEHQHRWSLHEHDARRCVLQRQRFALALLRLDVQLRFETVEGYRFDAFGQHVTQRLRVRLLLLGRGGKLSIDHLQIFEAYQAVGLVDECAYLEVRHAEDGRLVGSGRQGDGDVSLECEAVPGIQLRLVDGKGLAVTG